MARTIQRVDAACLSAGQYIIPEDDPDRDDAYINEAYSAEEQDWERVVRVEHRGGQVRLTLDVAHPDHVETTGWSQGFVWRLMEDGKPVQDA